MIIDTTIALPACYASTPIERLAESVQMYLPNCVVTQITRSGTVVQEIIAVRVIPPSFYSFDRLEPMIRNLLPAWNVLSVVEAPPEVLSDY